MFLIVSFRYHGTKHDHLKGFALVQEIQINRFRTDLELFDKIVALMDRIPNDLKIETQTNLKTWFELKKWVDRYDERKVSYQDIKLWAENANNDKNNGFYVDLRNENWETPKSISKDKYTQESKYTLAIIDFILETEKMYAQMKKNI